MSAEELHFKQVSSDSSEVQLELEEKSSDEIGIQCSTNRENQKASQSCIDDYVQLSGLSSDVNILNCLKPGKLFHIELNINNQIVKTLIDTGASISLIRKSTYKNISTVSLNNIKTTINGLNDTQIMTKGTIDLTVNYFGRYYFYIRGY